MWEALQGRFEHARKLTGTLLNTNVYQVASGLKSASLLCYRKIQLTARSAQGLRLDLFWVCVGVLVYF